jgi:hypothetical protein
LAALSWLQNAIYATEELVETGKLFLLLKGYGTCLLSHAEVDNLIT